MKSLKILFALCILFCFATNAVNAQEKVNGTVSSYMYVEIELELWCGDVPIDFIQGVIAEAHVVVHYKNGNRIWMKFTVHGTFVFKEVTYEISGLSKLIDEDIQEAHYNIKGDDGSHYVGIVTVSDQTGEFTFSKALCPGN